MQIHEKQEIVSRFQRCQTMQAIADGMLLPYGQVKEVLVARYGPNPRVKRDQELADDLIARIDRGQTIAQLVAATGINERTIQRRLVGRRPARKKLEPAVLERVDQMLQDCTPRPEIADTLGITINQVARLARGKGWGGSEAAEFRVWLSRNPQARSLLKWN